MLSEHTDQSDVNEWKAIYLGRISNQYLFVNGSFAPIENALFFEPIFKAEPSREVRDV